IHHPSRVTWTRLFLAAAVCAALSVTPTVAPPRAFRAFRCGASRDALFTAFACHETCLDRKRACSGDFCDVVLRPPLLGDLLQQGVDRRLKGGDGLLRRGLVAEELLNLRNHQPQHVVPSLRDRGREDMPRRLQDQLRVEGWLIRADGVLL